MFKTETSQIDCDECGRPTKHERTVRYPNHILHLILSILTAGVWVFVWILISLFPEKTKWQCAKCGEFPVVAMDFGDKIKWALMVGIPAMVLLSWLVAR